MLLYRFGITLEQFNEILEQQGGLCAICKKLPGKDRSWTGEPVSRLSVDHDHTCCLGKRSCGKCVRGLLCKSCNTALGLLGDDVEGLRRALAYLEAACV